MPVSVNACVPQLRFEEVENKTASLARQMEQAIENRTRALHVAMSSPPPHPDPPKLGRPRLRCAAQIIPYRLLTTPPRFGQASSGANGRLKQATKRASFGCNQFRCSFPSLKNGRCNELVEPPVATSSLDRPFQ